MSKYTPGPWRTGSLVSYNGATGEPEAFVYRRPPDDPEETAHNRICVRGSKSMDCDADARLISAAPDLLEALRAMELFASALIEMWKADMREDHERGMARFNSAGFVEAIQGARFAISKAESER